MTTIVCVTLILVFTFLSMPFPSRAKGLGFSVDLIHRDSSLSPLYNPSLTPFERLSNRLKRSQNRVNHFIPVRAKKTSSEIIPDGGEYLMKIALGTPPFTVFAIADTGSNLIWTQCEPCTHCYKQKAPVFDPKKSSTYRLSPCNSESCVKLSSAHSCTVNRTCEYSIRYGDGSYSEGTLASETLTLGSENVFPGINFGCGLHNGGNLDKNKTGIIGLGVGYNSLISQLKSSIGGKFSYCFADPWSPEKEITSKINFGENAVVSGAEVVSTPMVQKDFYYLTLETLYFGEHRLNVFNSSSNSDLDSGNIIIDSGATLTYLPSIIYNQLELLVKKVMGNKTVEDPKWNLPLCYKISDKPSFPTMRVQFTDATINLEPINTFVQTDEDVTCLAFAADDQFSIFGNVAQTNFLVSYDLVKGTVSFKREKCGHVTL